jgi:hypothetical protein
MSSLFFPVDRLRRSTGSAENRQIYLCIGNIAFCMRKMFVIRAVGRSVHFFVQCIGIALQTAWEMRDKPEL